MHRFLGLLLLAVTVATLTGCRTCSCGCPTTCGYAASAPDSVPQPMADSCPSGLCPFTQAQSQNESQAEWSVELVEPLRGGG
ncbi:MAG: hypothetical protein U0935_04835 [Pirellulales bacterium]